MGFFYFVAGRFGGHDARFFAMRPKFEETFGDVLELFVASGLAEISVGAKAKSVLHIAPVG